MAEIKIVRYGQRLYLKQESAADPRGNRYLGPLSSKELEILGHRAILKAKLVELKAAEEADGEEAA